MESNNNYSLKEVQELLSIENKIEEQNLLRQQQSMNKTKQDLIIFSIKYKNKQKKSFMSSIHSIASSLFYNYFHSNIKFAFEQFKKVYLFDKEIDHQKDFDNGLYSLLFMSYRNNVNPMYSIDNNSFSTSDCGWGCMIRSCQMMLSKGIMEIKKKKIKTLSDNFQYMAIMKLREEILFMFNDNSIPVENVISLEDYDYFFKGISEIAFNYDMFNDLEEVISPFSIQTICKVSQCANKWTSSIKTINSFIEINSHLYNKIRITHFINGYVREMELYNAYCDKITCKCDINALGPYLSLCKKCFCELPNNDNDIFILQGNAYRFSHEGIVFISLRLGLNEVEKEYLNDVKSLFFLKNNIGFVSGIKDRAYYFIGYTGEYFMFLDPHLNQAAIDITKNDFSSYQVKDIYLLKPDDMSPELTLGIVIKNADDLRDFINEIKQKRENNYFISIK